MLGLQAATRKFLGLRKEQARFFEKDALLYEKHPERYRVLFEFERHFERTVGFSEHLLKGFTQSGIEPPRWLTKKLQVFCSCDEFVRSVIRWVVIDDFDEATPKSAGRG